MRFLEEAHRIIQVTGSVFGVGRAGSSSPVSVLARAEER